ncbi:MAG: hypothetical protein LBQ57_02745 [Spirochaetales bacterium]|jgi:hypothetical protein|nr:hypothetical protein [Spirochaetales bacterium]
MKKFIVLFILLLALGGTGFYFGWVQLSIPAGSRGVIFTKTHGWEARAAQPGAFAWRWEKLIPGNFTLYLYPDTIYTDEILASGSLPSADVYNLFLDGRPEFTYSLRLRLSYRVKDDYFPVLAMTEGVLPDGLEAWLESARTGISAKSAAAVASWFEKTRQEPLPPGSMEKELAALVGAVIGADYPFLEVTGLAPLEMTFPDAALYAKGRELYLERADSRKQTLRESAGDMMSSALREDARMESLKKYGELLTQYPILLDFLKIEKDLALPPGGR